MNELAGLAKALGIGSDDDEHDDASAPLLEAVIADLKLIHERYAAGCPFATGDIVTPRKGYNIAGDGAPNIVVEVASNPIRSFTAESGSAHASQAWGARIDMRVAHLSRGEWIMHWVESWQYEPFASP